MEERILYCMSVLFMQRCLMLRKCANFFSILLKHSIVNISVESDKELNTFCDELSILLLSSKINVPKIFA